MSEPIIIRGLKQNNLKNISLDIPKNKIVVFTGVSGSGKSSIVFDTVAAESQRQMNETYSAWVSRFPPSPVVSASELSLHRILRKRAISIFLTNQQQVYTSQILKRWSTSLNPLLTVAIPLSSLSITQML